MCCSGRRCLGRGQVVISCLPSPYLATELARRQKTLEHSFGYNVVEKDAFIIWVDEALLQELLVGSVNPQRVIPRAGET
ncbi:hypothetical protein TNCT_398261 [Trichonephila clavata]|uniref:Uncharacterized protein n=1 Tax=Trichonephila clavata TaxID=2740835 RepID=A0A8X6F5B9_TRICU|nr:hypothetical protein TNCT_398261 [Trichonephila clavata]